MENWMKAMKKLFLLIYNYNNAYTRILLLRSKLYTFNDGDDLFIVFAFFLFALCISLSL